MEVLMKRPTQRTRCPQCEQGLFPLDEQLAAREIHWSEIVAQQAVWLCGQKDILSESESI
jgi:uncharacterized protein with PIN domain